MPGLEDIAESDAHAQWIVKQHIGVGIDSQRQRCAICESWWPCDLVSLAALAVLRAAALAEERERGQRMRQVVKGAWRFWADITCGFELSPVQIDRGYAVIRVHPDRLAAFDALFRSSAALAEARAQAAPEASADHLWSMRSRPGLATDSSVMRACCDQPQSAHAGVAWSDYLSAVERREDDHE